MKDALGHGRNAILGVNELPNMRRFPLPSRPMAGSGEYPARNSAPNQTPASGGAPMSSNAQAAQSLMSALKSTQAPVHPAMAARSPDGGSAS